MTDGARGDPGWAVEEEPFGVGARPAAGRDQRKPAGQGERRRPQSAGLPGGARRGADTVTVRGVEEG